MIGKHGIYVLKLEEFIFYVGYTCNRPIQHRLTEHITDALFPNEKEQKLRLIKGCMKPKDKWITTAFELDLKLEIEIVYSTALYKPVDECYWIQHYKDLGCPITNISKGNIHQPFVFSKGRLTKPVKELQKVENVVDHVEDENFKMFCFQYLQRRLVKMNVG